MAAKWAVLIVFIWVLFFSGFSSASASPPARIVANVISSVASTFFKWLWSLNTQPTTKTTNVITSRSSIKFEGGYEVETLFDGSKLGIQPYSVEATSTGELLILDSVNSNLHRVPAPLSRYSRPKLFAGSAEGYTGHVDGKLREARMHNPKGMAVDGRGNIYVADVQNMAIRKISGDTGVITTIAGVRSGRGGGNVDGPSEDAKFSDDFEVVYIAASCSLLVVDRGNQAIREIQLQFDDCNSSDKEQQDQDQNHHHKEQFDGSFHLGIAVLVATGFFGYMLALLHQRIRAIFSSHSDRRALMKNRMMAIPPQHYQRPQPPPIPPLIQHGEEAEDDGEEDEDDGSDNDHDEYFFTSFFRLIFNAVTSTLEIFGGLFSLFANKKKNKKKYHYHHRFPPPHDNRYHRQLYPSRQVLDPNWPPVPESYMIRGGEDHPSRLMEARPAPRMPPPTKQAYPFVEELDDDHFERRQEIKQNRVQQSEHSSDEVCGEQHHQRHSKHTNNDQIQQQQQQKHQRHSISKPSEKGSGDQTNHEVVFGAVQEQNGRRDTVVIKAVDYSDPAFNHQDIRPRVNYMGYSSSFRY